MSAGTSGREGAGVVQGAEPKERKRIMETKKELQVPYEALILSGPEASRETTRLLAYLARLWRYGQKAGDFEYVYRVFESRAVEHDYKRRGHVEGVAGRVVSVVEKEGKTTFKASALLIAALSEAL